MNEHDFTLTFNLEDPQADPGDFIEKLYEGGCDDALIGVGNKGYVALNFIREASSRKEAICSAINDVKKVIPSATLIEEPPDFVCLSDADQIIECTQQNILLSCFNVAGYFIRFANKTGSFLNNLKLQKLVYYAQAWHLALHDTPLFPEDFQAWVHGPVIPELYQEYKKFGGQRILKDADPKLPKNVEDFLDEVAKKYFACDPYELEQMTHAEDPWKLARGDMLPEKLSDTVIKQEWMKEYYKSRVEEN
jgi:uncharacterized phage-associated protein